ARRVSIKTYSDAEWTVLLNPIPDFKMFIIFMLKDEEFPSEIKIYYSKSSLSVPTEDAYIITLNYLEILGALARTEMLLEIQSDQLLSLEEYCKNMITLDLKKVYHDVIEQREIPLKEIPKSVIVKIVEKLAMEYVENWEGGNAEWIVKKHLFKDLDIYYLKIIENGNIAFNIYMPIGVLHYDPDIIYHFLWVFLNAIIREARKVMGDALPRISKYL
ncbi:MAG: DUF3786 domain-containing protein, partial [Candidatus Helarchaeota archaeon]